MSNAYSHVVVLDFEATCDDRTRPMPQEVIEFPSVLLCLESLEIVDEFSSFVRPHHHPVLTKFCQELTSIRQEDVSGAEPFPEVFAKHHQWLQSHGLDESNALAVTCGDWDLLTMLPAQCAATVPPIESIPPFYTRWQNIKRPFIATMGGGKAPGMGGMLKALGLPLVGHHHRGIDDCRNIAAIYLALLARGAIPAPTMELPASKYPPCTVRLCLDQRVEEVVLQSRSISELRALVGKTFQQPFRHLSGENGRAIRSDGDLLRLASGERIHVRR